MQQNRKVTLRVRDGGSRASAMSYCYPRRSRGTQIKATSAPVCVAVSRVIYLSVVQSALAPWQCVARQPKD